MTVNIGKIDPRALRYSVVVRPDHYPDGTIAYIAEIPDLPGCKSHGATPEEARANVLDAQGEYITAMVEAGLEIPPAKHPVEETVWVVQVPGTTHEQTRGVAWPTVEVEWGLQGSTR